MKNKHLLGILFVLMLLGSIGSAFAFWHPPPDDERPPCPTFVVVIEDEGMLTTTHRFNFTEPEYHFCSDVTVEVWIINVEDMFAYEFKLYWDNTYFTLTAWNVEDVWPSQFVVKPDAAYAGAEPYHQAVSALAPSTGVSGDFHLATLTFHIINDVCWRQAPGVDGVFWIEGLKASNSCSDPIDLCCPYQGWWTFIPVQPRIYIDPEEEVNCVVGETFVSTIWVENIAKMKSLHFNLTWKGNEVKAGSGVYRPIKCTTEDDIVINSDVFPADDIDTYTITLGDSGDNKTFWLVIHLVMDCDFPLINGTFWAFQITWLKQDPWECGRQPKYTKTNHEWDTTNATTPQEFYKGYFDVECPTLLNIYFGTYYGTSEAGEGNPTRALYGGATFTFDPVPGDLNGDGVVDIIDLTIIASFYGQTHPYTYPAMYYDFVDPLNIIDIFDVTVVAKNFGRECPY